MMQRAQAIDTAKPRGSIRQGAGYATAPGFARCLSPEREHSDPQTANRVRQGAACAAPYILSTVSTRTQKTPRFASERLFSVVLHSESPERNTLSACIRVCRSRTERPQARRDRLRRESTRSPAGWERRTRGPRSPDQGRRAPWRRCRTASCETPASRRCLLPPAAPK